MRSYDEHLVIANRLLFIDIIAKLHLLLESAGCNAQAEVLSTLCNQIKNNKIPDFVKLINSVDMWGGSGAVWEVYIEDKIKENEFENTMINLINLMENTGILGNGIKPIRKLFTKNLR